MKVMFYIQSMIAGGAQRVVATLSNYWVERGWEMTIVSLADVNTDFYTLDSRIVRLQLGGESSASEGGVLANLQRIRRLRSLILERRPDVAVAMMETASVVLGFAGIGTSTVLIGSERIHPPFSEIPAHWHWMRDRFFGRLRVVVAQTTISGEWLKQHTRARDVRVIPNPIELPLDRHEPIIGLPPMSEGERLLLAVGRLVPQKSFATLIEAFSRVALNAPQWKLAIVGDGIERAALAKRAAGLGLADRVLLPGKAGNAGDWYQRADLFAMTSIYEGFPNTLLEALAHGVPAVSFDCAAGPRDLIRPEIDGLLVTPGDTPALAAALDRLMRDDALRNRFSANAGEAVERFAVARVAESWRALFEELAAERRER